MMGGGIIEPNDGILSVSLYDVDGYGNPGY